jgi:hypothetical protein
MSQRGPLSLSPASSPAASFKDDVEGQAQVVLPVIKTSAKFFFPKMKVIVFCGEIRVFSFFSDGILLCLT